MGYGAARKNEVIHFGIYLKLEFIFKKKIREMKIFHARLLECQTVKGF